jgi:hypothetical protein
MGAYRARGNGVEVTDFGTIIPPGTTFDSENSPCVIVGKAAAFGLNVPYVFFSDNDVSGWIGVSAEL